jgi:hypothetical protein
VRPEDPVGDPPAVLRTCSGAPEEEITLSAIRERRKSAAALALAAILALTLSGCALFKPGSLRFAQPGGIGPVSVHFELCTRGLEDPCIANPTEGQSQYMLGIAIPKGASAPQTLRAESLSSGAAIAYVRNEEVTQAIDEAIQEELGQSWPPPGSDAVGFLSNVFNEEPGSVREWAINADFGLPEGTSPFAGPFKLAVIVGWRRVDATHSADRTVSCYEPGSGMDDETAICAPGEEKEFGVADLRISAHQPVTKVFVGGRVLVPFDFEFASTAATQPTFSFSPSSNLPGGILTPVTDGFATGPLTADTHLIGSSGAVTVQAPNDAELGTYEVSLTGTASGGAATSAVAKLQVVKATLRVGRPRLNRKRGTALLPVTVPDAGILTLRGRGVRSLQREPQSARTLRIPIKPRGKAKGRLGRTGKARVSARLKYKPLPGMPVTVRKALALRQTARR